MNKEEFLIQLRECLEGQITEDELVDALAYYRSYFQEEENSGKTEEEIVHFLGSPRLIAHSIIDAHEEAVTGSTSGYYDAEEEIYEDGMKTPTEEKMGELASKMKMILGIVLVIAVVAAVFNLLLPVLVVLAVFLGIYRLLQR